MTQKPVAAQAKEIVQKAAWLPLIVITMAQIQMAFNVNAIPVSVGPISEELYIPATAVGTALVYYSMFVAAFVLLGAKIGQFMGERLAFQVSVLAHGAAMGMMALSTDESMMNYAQMIAGIAAAIMVPTLVMLVAANYRGKQQAQALGILAGAPAISGALAFFIAGFLGTNLSWRYSFGLLVFLSIAVFLLSFRMKSVPRQPGVKIDLVGATLAAIAIVMISFGFNNLNAWGIILAKPAAPISLLGLSPAPFMIIIGIVVGQSFFAWLHRRSEQKKTPLLSLELVDEPQERSALSALLVIAALGPAVNFLIPLYIQIVQNQTSLFTAVAVVPYTLAIALSAIMIVRLYDRFAPKVIGIVGFLLVTIGLTILAFTIQNDWGTPVVILGLITVGLGEGALLTLLFNVLVSSAPKRLAGQVGALRGVANNLATALGTAFASVVAVGLLSVIVTISLSRSAIPDALKRQVDLDNVNFITNQQLKDVLAETSATSEQVDEAVQINIDARLRALQASFLILAVISLLALIPITGLPRYWPEEVPVDGSTDKKQNPPKRPKTTGSKKR